MGRDVLRGVSEIRGTLLKLGPYEKEILLFGGGPLSGSLIFVKLPSHTTGSYLKVHG